jgi:hypothetical protein
LRHISGDTNCPVHPNANHTWGECYSNAANKKVHKTNGDKEKKRQGKPEKEEVDGHAAHVGKDNVSIMSNVTSLGATDSVSTASAPHCKNAVNDDRIVLTVTDGMFAQLCLDLNNKADDPDALLAKFKAACAVKATADGMYVCDAFTSMTTHHLHNLLFQEINTTVYNKIVGLYVQYSDEVYSNRVHNFNNELSFDKALRLHATSHANVQTIQNTM